MVGRVRRSILFLKLPLRQVLLFSCVKLQSSTVMLYSTIPELYNPVYSSRPSRSRGGSNHDRVPFLHSPKKHQHSPGTGLGSGDLTGGRALNEFEIAPWLPVGRAQRLSNTLIDLPRPTTFPSTHELLQDQTTHTSRPGPQPQGCRTQARIRPTRFGGEEEGE